MDRRIQYFLLLFFHFQMFLYAFFKSLVGPDRLVSIMKAQSFAFVFPSENLSETDYKVDNTTNREQKSRIKLQTKSQQLLGWEKFEKKNE
jgi:hypothetical protein